MKNRSVFFYDRFVNEESLKQINDISISRKFWVYGLSTMMFSMVVGTLPTFIGYNFENVFAIGMFVWEMLMFGLLLYFSVRLVLLDRRYSAFKKRWHAPIFCLGFLALSVGFAIVAIFTTTFTHNPDTSFSVSINPAFYFLIFLPLYFAYVIFCYYAFMKCFAKYAKSGKRLKEN